MKYLAYFTFVLAVLLVTFKLKSIQKHLSQERDANLEKSHALEKNFSEQLAELQAQFDQRYTQSVNEQQLLHSRISALEHNILELDAALTEAQERILALKRQLEFFTEIKTDSIELNVDSPSKQASERISITSEEPIAGLDEEQKKAFDLVMNTNENAFITGKAGTGKSFLLKTIVAHLTKKNLVLAPTGISAINVHGATIHSAFGFDNFKMDVDVDKITKRSLKLQDEKRVLLEKVETIIIDEISMVRSDVLTKVDKILQVLNNTVSPFGGKQIVLFGDPFQLPPVAKGEEKPFLKDKYGGRYFFHSPSFYNANFHLFELTVNHRQKGDTTFFSMLNNFREGNINQIDIDTLNERASADIRNERRIMKLFSRKEDVKIINVDELSKIQAKEYIFNCSITFSKDNLTPEIIDNNFPISASLHLKLGATIMMVTNDVDRRWVNGTMGIVSFITSDRIKVTIEGNEYEIYRETFHLQEAIYADGKIEYKDRWAVEQYPIALAYAMTIHKSQGKTYNKVACDLTRCFECGQAYVALSRCTSLEGLYLLNRVERNSFKCDNEVVEFYRHSFGSSR